MKLQPTRVLITVYSSSLKYMLPFFNRSEFLEVDTTSFDHVLLRKICSCRYGKGTNNPKDTPKKAPDHKAKRLFKFGIEVPIIGMIFYI